MYDVWIYTFKKKCIVSFQAGHLGGYVARPVDMAGKNDYEQWIFKLQIADDNVLKNYLKKENAEEKTASVLLYIRMKSNLFSYFMASNKEI